jgi:NADH:ubiquinone oxidoreductase subunit D
MNSVRLGWNVAIEDARAELNRALHRVDQLRQSILILMQHKEAGDQWPVKS